MCFFLITGDPLRAKVSAKPTRDPRGARAPQVQLLRGQSPAPGTAWQLSPQSPAPRRAPTARGLPGADSGCPAVLHGPAAPSPAPLRTGLPRPCPSRRGHPPAAGPCSRPGPCPPRP